MPVRRRKWLHKRQHTRHLLQQKYPNKINLFHKKNEGVSSARNLGIQKATGKYISFLDADDSWLPDKIEYQIKIILNFLFINGTKGRMINKENLLIL